ncbi:MAG TPA: ATP-binding protein [Bryobacteraceae bacterium]|nr:ATP-binding protein [Bryobacteraceae bacterium]
MTTTDTSALFAALGLAVFEHRADGLFNRIGPTPAWLQLAGDPVDLVDAYPLLDLFLSECEENWTGHSDVWTEPDPDRPGESGEFYLQAVAAEASGRRYLAIKSLPQALFTYQQLAHDFELEKDKVEKLSRELEIKRAEAERATQAKSDFLASMSHEIRTPLNAIIGMADVLSGTALTGDQQKCVDVFQRNGVALLTLINDILDLSKVESGRVELESIEMDLRDVVARAMEVVENRATTKSLALNQTIAAAVPVHLIGDPNRLRQIIINLLGNSIKFTDKGGLEVLVDFDPNDNRSGRLRFGIRDSGIGIPADKLSAIFDSFTQVDASTTRKYGGTGLGLTISKQLVELMDGRIWAESTLGVGSTFYFTAGFGLQESWVDGKGKEEEKTKATIEEIEATLAGARILLADDSEDNRYLILSYLKRSQAVVEIAENGEIAARKFREGDYDVVLMDVEMPVMDGSQATAAIRAQEKETGAQPTPVLALTAHAFADMAARSLEAGFTAVLTKPIRKATLLEALAAHCTAGGFAAGVPKNVIEVEDDMKDVVPGYLEKRRAEITVYNEALAASDFDAIKKLAHKMKGTGAGYGFPVLTELGATLEKAAIDGNAGQLAESLRQFAVYLESIELKYSV